MSILEFRDETRFLSNFFPVRIVVDSVSYETVEHAFQSMKATNVLDAELVRSSRSPGEAKRKGKLIDLRPDWAEVKDDIMLMLVRAKFNQHADLKQKLLDTGDQELVEGNTWGDCYWGVCRGTGLNKLGKILMKVRQELKNF